MAAEPPSSTICCDAKTRIKPKVELSWNNTNVFLGRHAQIFPGPLHGHETSTDDCMGLHTDFNKKTQQTKLHAGHLVLEEVPVQLLLLHTAITTNMGTKMH